MRYFIGPNIRFALIENVYIVGNVSNGNFIGLSNEGVQLFKRIKDGEEVEKDKLNEDMTSLIDTSIEMKILDTNSDISKDNSKINFAYLHVTNNCNFNCIGCYSRDEYRNSCTDLSLEQITKILDELKNNELDSLVISGGEPFLRDDLHQIVKYAKEIGIDKVIIATNGSYVDRKVLDKMCNYVDRIVVAVDSYALDGPKYIRDEGSTRKAIIAISEIKKSKISVSMLPTVHSKNYLYIDKYMQLARELDVPISFSILTCSPHIGELGKYVLSGDEFYKMITLCAQKAKDMQPIFNDVSGDLDGISFRDSCGAGSNLLSVDALGNVYPCHMLHYKEFKLGNLLENSLQSILSSEVVSKFLSTTIVDEVRECSECSYKYFCGGGCKARRYFVNGEVSSKDCYCDAYLFNYKKFGDYISTFSNDGKNS